MTDSTTAQKVAAEVIGTGVLVLFGCGSVVYAVESAGDAGFVTTTTTVGLTFGLALMVMIYAFGRVSGAHFNPAVSVGAAMGGRLAWSQVPVYVAAQLVGAVVGAGLLFALLHGFEGFDPDGNMGQNGFGSESAGGYALWAALLLELVLTLVFVWVILAVTDERNEHPALAPLAIGFTLTAIHFVAIPATGTSVNPARSIGPALFAGGDAIGQVWLFVVAPLLGGAIAGLTYSLLFGPSGTPVAGSGLQLRPGTGRRARVRRPRPVPAAVGRHRAPRDPDRAPVDPRADRRLGGAGGPPGRLAAVDARADRGLAGAAGGPAAWSSSLFSSRSR